MLWVLWFLWFAYCLGVVPTWCAVYLGKRTVSGRVVSWLVASGLALIWPPFVWQYRRWLRRRTVASEAEEWLATQSATR